MIQPPTLHKQTRVVMTSTVIFFFFILLSPSPYLTIGCAVETLSGGQMQFQASPSAANVVQLAYSQMSASKTALGSVFS